MAPWVQAFSVLALQKEERLGALTVEIRDGSWVFGSLGFFDVSGFGLRAERLGLGLWALWDFYRVRI
jgi:hypothetical protein